MTVTIDLSIASHSNQIPSETAFKKWVNAVAISQSEDYEISIHVIDEKESSSLNHTWRNKEGPTNVLSFPADLPEGVPISLLGDLAVCAPVIEKEASEQAKSLEAHWAHIIIHGTLHLFGYDHVDESEAEEMESMEIDIMKRLGFSNPYNIDVIN